MAIFEGPAPTGDELSGAPPAASQAPPASPGLAEIPPLTPERSRQELEKLAAIITSNATLNFLEPRVKRCQANGGADMAMLLSFYRLISQALAEELNGQRDRLQASQSALAQAKQTSVQAQMQAALEEASQAVQLVSRGESSSPSSGGPAASEEVLAKLEQSEKQSERLLQDMQNMRNRSKIDVDVKVFKEVEKFSLSLIPALDAFNQAMATLQVTTDITSVVTGVKMIHEQLLDSLEKAGLKRMKVVGERFDPRYHEAIGEVPCSDVPDEHVYDELQPGYMLGERMIRAAMVRLARNDAPPAPSAPAPAEASAQPQAEGAPQAEAPAQMQPPPQAAPAQAAAPTPPSEAQAASPPAADPFPPAPPTPEAESSPWPAAPHEETSAPDPNP